MSVEVRGLTKTYGSETVVQDVSFDVHPGEVVGFVGPNGAGKTTTMRLMLGLTSADTGTCTFEGDPYRDLDGPMRMVGAVLGGTTGHPRRRIGSHLHTLARSNQIPRAEVERVLTHVGLSSASGKRIGTLSLGMGQRLALAEALLGNPRYLLLDEPFTGLDLDGIRWLRSLLAELASRGAGILFSNHHMAEMELLADRLVIIGGGQILANDETGALIDGRPPARLAIRADHPGDLINQLQTRGFRYAHGRDALEVQLEGRRSELIELLDAFAIESATYRDVPASLEDVFLEMTGAHVHYAATEVPA